MRIAIIPNDKAIAVDGVAVIFDANSIPFPASDNPAIQVIHWHGDTLTGTLQWKDGSSLSFKSPAAVKPYLDAFHVERRRRATASLAAVDKFSAESFEEHKAELREYEKYIAVQDAADAEQIALVCAMIQEREAEGTAAA
jgi:hypothetical protein